MVYALESRIKDIVDIKRALSIAKVLNSRVATMLKRKRLLESRSSSCFSAALRKLMAFKTFTP